MSARQAPKGGISEYAGRFSGLSRLRSSSRDQNAKQPSVHARTISPAKPSCHLRSLQKPRSLYRRINRLTPFFPRLLGTMLAVMLCLSVMPLLAQTPAASPAAAHPQQGPTQSPIPSARDHSTPKPAPPPPWQILSEGAADHKSERRAEAVAALGTIGPKPRVIAIVERALNDKDPSIRELAAKTLGELRARRSIPKLKQALNDDSPEVRFAAAKSLWTMGNHAGEEVFIDILSGGKSASNGLVENGLEATRKKFQDPGKLAIFGAKEAATSLFGPAGWGIKIVQELAQDRSASARAMSAILLGRDRSLDALPPLRDALADKNWIVRAAAAQALGACRHRDQIRYLRPLLEDEKPAVRYMAAASIVRLSTGSAETAEPGRSSPSEARPAITPRAPGAF